MKFGLLGEHISHSFSKTIHGMIGDYSYSLFDVPKVKFADFMTKRAFKGINITAPYKRDIIPYLDFLSDEVKKIGSANVAVFDNNGKLCGYNTDYRGFKYMIKKSGIEIAGKKVAILGNGGTSLTARVAVSDLGAREIVIISRKGENNFENISRHFDADIIVNATPIGMYPNNGGCLVKLTDFRNLSGVIDVIYNPLNTYLLLSAKEQGISYTNGLFMLVAQAKFAAEYFLEKEIPDDIIEKIHEKLKKSFTNIILIGMAGCGKSSLAKLLGERLGREVIDTDELVVEKAGMSIEKIFEEFGEAKFRELEAEICFDVSKLTGKIISTGGGMVLSQENRRVLSQNGFVVFIDREPENLSRENRPLSKDIDSVRNLYNERYPIYSGYADKKIDNNGDIAETFRKVIECSYENTCD